ncbi:MAG: ImuA family protein [Xanthobacteraceae bacterium]
MPSANTPLRPCFDLSRNRAETVDDLRHLLGRLEGIPLKTSVIPFGLPAIDARLPQGGLACGALHEVAPQTEGDMPAAFGFIAALLRRMPPGGPVLIVLSSRKFARCGRPHGHGLRTLGLDPARVILAETPDEKLALWAIEKALHSRAPSAVVGAVGAKLDLKTSQRLNFAAAEANTPLVLLRPVGAIGTNTAVTRWRVGAAMAARDRFGLLTRWRWRLELERCRNGRVGEWLVEFDHVANCFSLAAAMADPAHARAPDTQAIRRAG